jgi:hypothetical protein
MKKYTVILPIHIIDETNKSLAEKAIMSLLPHKDSIVLMTVSPIKVDGGQILNVLNVPSELEWYSILNEGETDFCSQVNLGIDNVKTEWFSILELDDTYSPTWFKNVNKYSEAYPEMDAFLPIVTDYDADNKFMSFTNETLWALGFANVQGELDNELLLEFQNIQISGAVYKTEQIKKYGKFKTNLKLSFGYEYMLRLTHNNLKIMTIPKTGYKHVNMRTNSLFWQYKNDEALKLKPEEAKFWMDTARKEFYFTEQRDINVTV